MSSAFLGIGKEAQDKGHRGSPVCQGDCVDFSEVKPLGPNLILLAESLETVAGGDPAFTQYLILSWCVSPLSLILSAEKIFANFSHWFIYRQAKLLSV